MGTRDRSRIRNNRKRFNLRKIITIKNSIILCVITLAVIVCTSVITKIALDKKVKKSTIVYSSKDKITYSDNNENSLYVENDINDNESQIYENSLVDEKPLNNTITINFLGEIMMGGNVGKILNFSYASAFKGIYNGCRDADFTYANLSTNITNLDKIEDPKSKYIVTKDVVNALNALGVDCVSVASDHMMDFSTNMFNITNEILEQNSLLVAGKQDMPVYFEKENKKVAIVSTNSVILGTSDKYTKNGISIYTEKNLKKNIKEAKEVADVVIVDVHWGREYVYEVTDNMRRIAHLAIDEGADLVIGTHALGNYPIVKYKDKPIIYSMGYLMTDSDYTLAKEGFIYKIVVDENSKVSSIVMEPIIIDEQKHVNYYCTYDSTKCNEILELYNNWNNENSLDSKIKDSKIQIDF